jgi:hypothetical protein
MIQLPASAEPGRFPVRLKASHQYIVKSNGRQKQNKVLVPDLSPGCKDHSLLVVPALSAVGTQSFFFVCPPLPVPAGRAAAAGPTRIFIQAGRRLLFEKKYKGVVGLFRLCRHV